MERPELPFRPPGDRSRHVELGGRWGPAGEYEGSQRGMQRIEPVDLTLDLGHVPREQHVFRGFPTRADRQFRLRDEQLVLKPADDGAIRVERRGKQRLEPAELGAELVQRAVRRDAEGVLRYARTMGEAGRAVVAGPGIETRDDLASGRQGNWSSGELSP